MSENKTGLGIGAILAILISVALNKSFLWAFVHMICGWFYVVYALIFYGTQIIPGFKLLLGI